MTLEQVLAANRAAAIGPADPDAPWCISCRRTATPGCVCVERRVVLSKGSKADVAA